MLSAHLCFSSEAVWVMKSSYRRLGSTYLSIFPVLAQLTMTTNSLYKSTLSIRRATRTTSFFAATPSFMP